MRSTHRPYLLAAAIALAGVTAAPLVVVPAALAAGADSAREPSPELVALREQGIEWLDRAVAGDDDAASESVERLERYLGEHPDDSGARAYLGAAYALMAREASSVANKVRYTNRGLRQLDRALAAAPRDFTVRAVRARVGDSLPKMFGRHDAALQDMLVLDELYREAPSPGRAQEMVGIYEALQSRAPDAGPWSERIEQAQTLAAGREDR